mgnify:CR=1 FL=1
MKIAIIGAGHIGSAIVTCLAQGHLYLSLIQSPSPRDRTRSRMPSSA